MFNCAINNRPAAIPLLGQIGRPVLLEGRQRQLTKPAVQTLFRRLGRIGRFILGAAILAAAAGSGPAAAGSLPQKGSVLPAMTIASPASAEERHYLGLGPGPTFDIGQIAADTVVLEIIGVYCPQCHVQLPLFNKLYFRLQKDPQLAAKVKFAAIAVGANATEVAYLKEQFKIPYPVMVDPPFTIHKQLAEPRTPFTMLITGGNQVAFAHLGIISDMDLFLKQIQLTIP
jgi:hypothetical protein